MYCPKKFVATLQKFTISDIFSIYNLARDENMSFFLKKSEWLFPLEIVSIIDVKTRTKKVSWLHPKSLQKMQWIVTRFHYPLSTIPFYIKLSTNLIFRIEFFFPAKPLLFLSFQIHHQMCPGIVFKASRNSNSSEIYSPRFSIFYSLNSFVVPTHALFN